MGYCGKADHGWSAARLAAGCRDGALEQWPPRPASDRSPLTNPPRDDKQSQHRQPNQQAPPNQTHGIAQFRQIRRHLKHLHHHLVGDSSHGDGRHNLAFRMRGVHRMLLHAWRLTFPHPHDGRRIIAVAPPDAEFRRALELLGLPEPDPAA